MKISFGFDVKSINKAVKSLEKAKKDLQGQVITDLLNGCCRWLISRANWHLDNDVEIGSAIKADIQSAWQISVTNNVAILTNQSDKSAYVEFGVGIVGAENEHPNADKTSWWYDLPTEYKDQQGGWNFRIDDTAELDLPQEALLFEDDNDDGTISIYTMGTKGAMYAFNALEDLRNGGAKEVWKNIKVKYWG